MLGEKGKEFVIDNDSYTAIDDAFPGLFDAINEAQGEDAVAALMEYTDYERPQQQEPMMAGVGGGQSPVSNEPSSNTASGGGTQMHRGGARARRFSFRYKHG